MKLQTKLGQHIYLNGPFEKFSISEEMLEEIGRAYCDRNNFVFNHSIIEDGIAYVNINAPNETLEMHTDFQIAFQEMGYSGVLLEVSDTIEE